MAKVIAAPGAIDARVKHDGVADAVVLATDINVASAAMALLVLMSWRLILLHRIFTAVARSVF